MGTGTNADITLESVDRIIASVIEAWKLHARQPLTEPADNLFGPDAKMALMWDLRTAAADHNVLAELRRGRGPLIRSLTTIRYATKMLLKELSTDDVRQVLCRSEIAAEDVAAALRGVDAAAENVLTPSTGREIGPPERSPFEWLAGKRLKDLFEKHFVPIGAPVGTQDNSSKSPLIAFVLAAANEMQVQTNHGPHTPRSIIRAMTEVNAGRPRSRRVKAGRLARP